MAVIRIGSGQTTPGSTNWVVYTATGIYVDVNTSSAGFGTTPVYVSSIGGNAGNWSTTGGSSIYLPTPTGFRVYVRWVDNSPITPALANSYQWHIKWIGMAP